MARNFLTQGETSEYNVDTVNPGEQHPRAADIDQQSAEASMKALLESRSASPGLPTPPKNPEYVSCWVPDDVSLYSDNASVRQSHGWTYATEQDYPGFNAYIAKDAVTSKASGAQRHFRYRECVLMKLPVGAHKAWMDYHHRKLPKEQEEAALRDIKRSANQSIGARLEGDDPFSKPGVTKVSTS